MERDLCIGGVELSNPCRTWAYLTGIGNRCFNGGGAPCCPGVAWKSFDYATLGLVGSTRWVVDTFDPVDDLMLMGARQMVLGTYTSPGTPCPPPEDLPTRYDDNWTPYSPGGVVLPVPMTEAPPLIDIPKGLGLTTCVLYAFDLAASNMAIGTLWIVGYVGAAAEPPVVMWEHADGTATPWGPPSTVAITPRVYTDPVTDAAPWYDPLDPRSADVLGVWIDDIVVGKPHNKTVQGRQWGGSLSSTRFGPREITFGGKIYVRNRAAGHYAEQWLYEALVGSPCGDGGCTLPNLQLTQWYDAVDPEAGVVWAHEVGLTDIQTRLDTTEPSDCFVSFTATLAAQVPWLTKAPRHITTEPVLQGDPFCDHCGTGTASGECPDPDPVATLECGCGDAPPLPLTISTNECYVRPIWVARHYVEVQSPKLWTDGALRFRIDGGTTGSPSAPSLKNLRFRVYHDPQGLGIAAGDTFVCAETPCADVSVGCVPYGSTLVIDGALRRGWVELNGTQRSADPYLTSNGGAVVWPEFACGSLLVAIDVDALQTSADSTFTLETVELQRV